MGLLNMRLVDDWFQMHLCNRLRKSDDSLELSDCDWNTVGLLGDSLLLGLLSVCDVEVLEHVAGFFRELGLDLALGIAAVLSEEFEGDLTFGFFVFGVHVKIEDVRGNSLIKLIFSDISHNEDGIKSGKN